MEWNGGEKLSADVVSFLLGCSFRYEAVSVETRVVQGLIRWLGGCKASRAWVWGAGHGDDGGCSDSDILEDAGVSDVEVGNVPKR